MRFRRNAVVAAIGLAVLMGSAADASAATSWEVHHPRRDQVIDRLHNQFRRISEERREGELTYGQARYLRNEDRAIFHREQFDARSNGGYITPAQQHALNQDENRVSNQIGR